MLKISDVRGGMDMLVRHEALRSSTCHVPHACTTAAGLFVLSDFFRDNSHSYSIVSRAQLPRPDNGRRGFSLI